MKIGQLSNTPLYIKYIAQDLSETLGAPKDGTGTVFKNGSWQSARSEWLDWFDQIFCKMDAKDVIKHIKRKDVYNISRRTKKKTINHIYESFIMDLNSSGIQFMKKEYVKKLKENKDLERKKFKKDIEKINIKIELNNKYAKMHAERVVELKAELKELKKTHYKSGALRKTKGQPDGCEKETNKI